VQRDVSLLQRGHQPHDSGRRWAQCGAASAVLSAAWGFPLALGQRGLLTSFELCRLCAAAPAARCKVRLCAQEEARHEACARRGGLVHSMDKPPQACTKPVLMLGPAEVLRSPLRGGIWHGGMWGWLQGPTH
jgi:hypothetical protein